MNKTEYQNLRAKALKAFQDSSKVKAQELAIEFSTIFNVPMGRIEVRENGVICADGLMFQKSKLYEVYILVIECAKCGRLYNYNSDYSCFNNLERLGGILENLGEGPFYCDECVQKSESSIIQSAIQKFLAKI